MTAIDRLIANSNSIIYSYKAFSATVADDVTFTWINDDDTESEITFNNIKKFQDKIISDMNTYTDNLTAEKDTFVTELTDEKNTFKTEITDSFNTQKQEIADAYDTFASDVNAAAIDATNIKYVDGVVKDKDDNVIPTQKTKAEVLADTNVQYDGAMKDRDGNIISMKDDCWATWLSASKDFDGAQIVDFDKQILGANITESAGKITVGKAGTYLVLFNGNRYSSDDGTVSGYIRRNGSTADANVGKRAYVSGNNAGNYDTVACSWVGYLDAGDTIELYLDGYLYGSGEHESSMSGLTGIRVGD